MICRTLQTDGITFIVCGARARRRRCACGRAAELLCDWKVGDGKTCDTPLCRACAEKVAPEKDLCPSHQAAYAAWKAARLARADG